MIYTYMRILQFNYEPKLLESLFLVTVDINNSMNIYLCFG